MADVDECDALREEEWQAFEAIYPDSVAVQPERCPTGTRIQLELPIDLGTEQDVDLVGLRQSNLPPESLPQDAGTNVNIRLVHLPPLLLSMILPDLYPLHAPPIYLSLHATHSWLPPSAQRRLLQLLGEKWDEQAGEGVLWTWAEWIRSGDFLSDVGLRDGDRVRIPHPAPDLLAPLLQRYDAQSRDTEFANETFSCAICLNEQKGSHCLKLSTCGHVFCRACLKDFWGLLIAEGDVGRVTCADPECVKGHVEVGEEDVRRACGEEAMERWKWLREKRELEKDPNIVYCPLQVCQAPIPRPPQEPSVAGKENRWEALRTCPRCGFSFCMFCRRTWHGVIARCAFTQAQVFVLAYVKAAEGSSERRAIEQRYGRANVTRLVAQYEEEEKNRAWLKASAMACAGCGVYVEKSFGCNHMTCGRCGMHFCYQCGQRLNARDPYKHFNDLQNKCALFDASELRAAEGWQPMGAFAGDEIGDPNWGEWRDE